MQTFIRVRDRATGHQYDVDERAFDEDTQIRVSAPRTFPPVTGSRVSARPAKHHTTKAGQPADSTEETPS